MENLTVALSAVLPLFLPMMLGYFLRKIKLVDGGFLQKANTVTFRVFLPILLFLTVYQSDVKKIFSGKLLLFATVAILGAYLLTALIIPLLEKDRQKIGVMVQGIFRSNFVIFGIPMAISVYGSGNIGPTPLLIAVAVPLYNVLAVIILEIYGGKKSSVKSIVMGVVTNPLIIAAALAFLLIGTGIRIPDILEHSLSDISKVATPMALIALGGEFQFSSISAYAKQITITVLGRLVILPCILLTISVLMGFRQADLLALLALFSSPTAVSTYVMAQNAGGDDELAGHIVVFTSLFSIVTIFCFVFILKSLAFI